MAKKSREELHAFFFMVLFAAVCAAPSVWAEAYGNYDIRRIPTITETPTGRRYGIDLHYLDTMLNDLATHAKNYPPSFDSDQDRQRATRDAANLAGMLGTLTQDADAHPEILFRAATVNSYGHNLKITGAAEKADELFRRLIALTPNHPRNNYVYGIFLAGVAKPRDSIPYLEKALSAGVADADYSLGMVHLTLGDKKKALEHLESYRARAPAGNAAAVIIEAIRSGRATVRQEAP